MTTLPRLGADWAAADGGGRDPAALLTTLRKKGGKLSADGASAAGGGGLVMAGDLVAGLRASAEAERSLAEAVDRLRQDYDMCGQRLQAAAERSDLPALRAAIQEVSVNYRDVDGLTALHWSAVKGHAEAADMLLGAGASASVADKWGMTPLHTVVDIRAAGGLAQGDTAILTENDSHDSKISVYIPGERQSMAVNDSVE